MIAEQLAVDQFLRATLGAGTALCALIGGTAAPRIWAHEAPQAGSGTAYPFVVFSPYTSEDTAAVNGLRSVTTLQYRVIAVARGYGSGPAGTIAAQADKLLQQAQGTVAIMGGTVVVPMCERVSSFEFATTEGGQRYCHVGGIYEIVTEVTGGL